MATPYIGREQTQAKHFILKRYLQALAFKVLNFADITYVDGFSGPWRAEAEDFADTSFMIAIQVLKDAQKLYFERTGVRRKIGCFFSETDPDAFRQLETAVAPHNKPTEGFEIKTYQGRFEDAVSEIGALVGRSFPIIFIDPTGWTGYPFDKIKSLFAPSKCEVLINFMYDFVNRFVSSDDETTIASLDPILGGPGWRERLDRSIPRGQAVEKLFRQTLQDSGKFSYVVSTKIDKGTVDRPHFFIAYGTKSREGLKAFREIEYGALREHARNRADAKERKREERERTVSMFPGMEADMQEVSVDMLVKEQKALASDDLLVTLAMKGPQRFSEIADALLQAFMLRETNVKDLCCELAGMGKIRNTWGDGRHKPKDDTIIRVP